MIQLREWRAEEGAEIRQGGSQGVTSELEKSHRKDNLEQPSGQSPVGHLCPAVVVWGDQAQAGLLGRFVARDG